MLARPRPLSAATFYLVYLAGIVVICLVPAVRHDWEWWQAGLQGAALGLAAYATYDLTNRATLVRFPVRIAALDLAWGTVLTAATASITSLV